MGLCIVLRNLFAFCYAVEAMETEIEAKFPNIDPNALRVKLKALGATLEHPEILMRRRTFDYADNRLEKTGSWVRVRDEGDKITLSYKRLDERTLHGTKELLIIVNDFEKACDLMVAIGLDIKSYQETKREKWMLGEVEATIDTWPWVPTFVELEGPGEEAVRKVTEQLGFEWGNARFGSVENIYQMHYDFTDEEIDHWETITFIPEPEWLLARKKQ